MRDNEKDPNINYAELKDNSEIIGTLVDVNSKNIEHILRLNYLVSLHKLSNKVLDSDTRLTEIKIEIPLFGVLILKVENNKIMESSFECEDYLLSDINNTLSTGESVLLSEAKKSVGKRINKRYRELL